MSSLRFFLPRFIFAFLRNFWLKLRYRRRIKLNMFRTYIEIGVRIRISGNGHIYFQSNGDRIYISRDCDLVASDGEIVIDSGFFMNKGCTIVSHRKIQIGQDVMLGPNVAIYDSDHRCELGDIPFRKQGYVAREVVIGSNVWIGENSLVTKGSVISGSVVVGANSIVRGTLESECLYAGSPVKKIKSLRN